MNYNETYMEHVNHETYDYERAMTEDVENWIEERDGIREIMLSNTLHDRDELAEYMNDEMWIDDAVTGNASGSYWCNAWKAHAALFNNLDLLHEAIDDFGGEIGKALDSAESADVTIRCYLLYRVIPFRYTTVRRNVALMV